MAQQRSKEIIARANRIRESIEEMNEKHSQDITDLQLAVVEISEDMAPQQDITDLQLAVAELAEMLVAQVEANNG